MTISTTDLTLGEMLTKIGTTLRTIGKYYLVEWGLVERNPSYLPLPQNNPLFINCQRYSVRRTQNEGEQDLVRLAHEVPYEGSWVYTPQDSVWYHVSEGHEEEFGEHGGFEFSSIQRNVKLTISGKEAIHYHTHPKKAGEHMTKYLLEEVVRMSNRIDPNTLKVFLTASMYLYTAFPSPTDVETYLQGSQSVQKKGPYSFQEKIASPMGITSIKIEDQSDDVVPEYQKIHDCLLDRILEGKYVRYEESNGEKTIAVSLENMFDDVNAELEGKLDLDFRQVNCGIAL